MFSLISISQCWQVWSEWSVNGIPFQIKGPTTKKARFCLGRRKQKEHGDELVDLNGGIRSSEHRRWATELYKMSRAQPAVPDQCSHYCNAMSYFHSYLKHDLRTVTWF